MDFRYSEEEERFRRELGEFLDNELTPEICRQNWEDKGVLVEGREFCRKLGARGWVGMSWPKAYGGQELSPGYDFILLEELGRRGTHYPLDIGLTMVGPIVLRYGSEDMKKEFIPPITRGEIEFALGYTEPGAGSDLAAMKMTAVEDGDSYVINGQKTFNTECHYADYHWLAVKTDPSAGYKGITLFIVDMDSPGITINAIWTLSGERTNEVFYDKVRVPRSRLVGEKNRGFYYMLEAIDRERITVFYPEILEFTLNGLYEYVKTAKCDGKVLAEDPLVRQKLGKIAVEVEVAKALAHRAMWMVGNKLPTTYEPTMVKLVVSEVEQHMANLGMEVLGLYSQLTEDSYKAPLKGRMEWYYRACLIALIGAGTSEIDRNVIAIRGLGLPRA